MNRADFSEFFAALHGKDVSPFPWQLSLLEQIATSGQWPAVLDLPTSAGKTAAIDIAVFHLALQSPDDEGRPYPSRNAALRILFVVDRRVVVDEAFQRASYIAQRLRDKSNQGNGMLAEVARRLLRFGGERPLHVAIMRGGTYRDDAWARSPVQPTVCVSTVDQVGSRLLFRGYGISEYQRSIHAALLGCDSLILVDEAHLSEPFLQTLEAVRRYSGSAWAEQSVTSPLGVVRMSATTQSDQGAFRLSAADRQHPVLQRRLEARKLA